MDKKFLTFLEIAKALNKKGITPIAYGSLGLYRITGQQDEINDIDIAIPNVNLVDKFSELEEIMAEIGYKRDPDYKHEFIRGENHVGFELENELTEWGIDTANLKITEVESVRFRELLADDYLKVYSHTLQTWEKKVVSIKNKVLALEKLTHK